MQILDVVCEAKPRPFTDDAALQRRIDAEFTDLPGLKLTLAQAARLFNLDRSRCEQVLRALVINGDLACDGTCFQRPGGGR